MTSVHNEKITEGESMYGLGDNHNWYLTAFINRDKFFNDSYFYLFRSSK